MAKQCIKKRAWYKAHFARNKGAEIQRWRTICSECRMPGGDDLRMAFGRHFDESQTKYFTALFEGDNALSLWEKYRDFCRIQYEEEQKSERPSMKNKYSHDVVSLFVNHHRSYLANAILCILEHNSADGKLVEHAALGHFFYPLDKDRISKQVTRARKRRISDPRDSVNNVVSALPRPASMQSIVGTRGGAGERVVQNVVTNMTNPHNGVNVVNDDDAHTPDNLPGLDLDKTTHAAGYFLPTQSEGKLPTQSVVSSVKLEPVAAVFEAVAAAAAASVIPNTTNLG